MKNTKTSDWSENQLMMATGCYHDSNFHYYKTITGHYKLSDPTLKNIQAAKCSY